MPSSPPHPPFSSLPLLPSGPRLNAWGLFGPADQLGMLNRLTPAVVAGAAKEIVTGVRIPLDMPLNEPVYPWYRRDPLEHRLMNRGAGRPINDDVLNFNTQISSQWDGFRHYGYLKEKVHFNGHTHDDVQNSLVIGTDIWAENGGIVGRGVLVDYADWAERYGITLSPLTSIGIPFAHLQRIVSEQDLQFRPGDILLLRTGVTAAFRALSAEEQKALADRPTMDFIGMNASEELLRWIWDQQFAAVAGDSPAFERSPPAGEHADMDLQLHQTLLAGWGMPIGELFDLERLARHCKETGRRTFFVSSVPLNVPGGVASPPNAVAIF